MQHAKHFYIDGNWVDPIVPALLDVIDPSTEEAYVQISVGSAADVDRAVAAAKAAFPSFARTSRKERLDLLRAILAEYNKRRNDVGDAISREMGAPLEFARTIQAGRGTAHLERMISVLETYPFETVEGTTLIAREPIGVCGLITPWNWPTNQIACKVLPALAAGCTMVLKPSEEAPIDALVWTEIMHAAGTPKGVYNMVQGAGSVVGEAMSSHPDIDMMSFTGSTRAGIRVAQAAAVTVKRVAQELGGKSANVLLPDVDFQMAVTKGINSMMVNSGQSCTAPSRMFVPQDRHDEVKRIAKAAAEKFVVGNPQDPTTRLGPVVNESQFNKIQGLIQKGIEEGAELVTGGPGRPENLNRGYYVRPTVFAGVTNDMTIAREEIFGPVICILPYKDEEEVIRLANDTIYGLAAYVQGTDLEHARKVAAQMRAGNVHVNYPMGDTAAPFGGYKQSGNGREYGKWGLEEFLETKAVIGYKAA
ncbi:aldehyde dehydrogenase family protein [Reyranella sp.]|jgi:aldehyde dehydrogenase (NAD+)|uniref:aldehyde dehydrogenase family protein n=1 Tax=Reyranella sp. TaxID=1929291 RepID=UPI000BD1930B|nr:aldehyde dehydrogenase family protein [Reyranella sp.]OYY35660.1 MAG: aldehyde dehydrogenase family protein [Rhodospirillales bacterium 35-66-84]OYZ91530.1 MAG: aldehyde dehydrogenase family protein [Rhodospirillales bacterium 24-66-33]OZB22067.1 MAG: aldehyde dehydrogenase family protein [Rhodospirillales bacterium 39-66-50]HQS14906.1 aldehyde dehydrogenase family protein [Reyranella sp.]HQT10715.1 aldehyde dehydrogenase family protein [Reyranella sp.]